MARTINIGGSDLRADDSGALQNLLVNHSTRATVAIASGAAVSETVTLTTTRPRGLAVLVPSAWTAADIGFEISTDNSAWVPLYGDTGLRIKITTIATAASQLYIAPTEVWAACAFPYLRLASLNTGTGANANQGAARSLIVVLLA